MSDIKITNNLPRFSRNMTQVMDEGFGELARDILVTARAVTPFDKGALRRESDYKRMSLLHWQVRYHMEYALAQEAGHAKGRQFRNYTTAGTGAGYLKKSGDKVWNKAIITLKKHAGRAKT